MRRQRQSTQAGLILLTSERNSGAMMGTSPLEHSVIVQIIKILLQVKFLGLSVQAHICNPTLGKSAEEVWGSIDRDVLSKKKKKGT